jgi:hypothetical protein
MNRSAFQPNGPYYETLRKLLKAAASEEELREAIVNAPFHELRQTTHLDLGIIVLLLVDKASGSINRIALSDTEAAHGAVKMSEKPFHTIKIPLGHKKNVIAQAIATQTPQSTSDWRLLFVPAMSAQAARFNQAGAGIECSYVYPLDAGDGGALIFSFYQPNSNISEEHGIFMETYARLASEALRNAL